MSYSSLPAGAIQEVVASREAPNLCHILLEIFYDHSRKPHIEKIFFFAADIWQSIVSY